MSVQYISGHMWFCPLPTIIPPQQSEPCAHQRERAAFYRLSTIPELDYDFSDDGEEEGEEMDSMYSYGDDAPTLCDQDIHPIQLLSGKELSDNSSSIYSYEDTDNEADDECDDHEAEESTSEAEEQYTTKTTTSSTSSTSLSSSSSVRRTTRYEDMASPSQSLLPHSTTSSTSSTAHLSLPVPKRSSTTITTRHEEAVLVRPATTLAIRVSSLSLREAKEVNHHARSRRASRKTRLLKKLSCIFTTTSQQQSGREKAGWEWSGTGGGEARRASCGQTPPMPVLSKLELRNEGSEPRWENAREV